MSVLQLGDVEEGAGSGSQGLLAKDPHDQLAVLDKDPERRWKK